jgi:Uncharacterized protein conserved in bacteria
MRFLAALVLFLAAPAFAQEWPAGPVHIIVPFGPGSTPDLVARVVADKLSPRIGKPVIVENKAGAGGNIGPRRSRRPRRTGRRSA